MGSSRANTACVLLYLYLILILFNVIAFAKETNCLPSENEKWNYKKQKCVLCPECGPGSFRNLSEPYTRRTGKHGAERCIKCRPCPKGTYSSTGYGECSRCRTNCAKLHREVSEPCSSQHDVICGSCLNGYFDMYKNTLFPCAPLKEGNLKELRELSAEGKRPEKSSDEEMKFNDNNYKDTNSPLNHDKDNNQSQNSPLKGQMEKTSVSNVIGILGACVAGVALVLFLTVLVTRLRRNSQQGTALLTTTVPSGNGQYGRVPRQDLSHDNDIEMDTFAHSDLNDASLYLQSEETHFCTATVRPEIPKKGYLQVRPELSRQCPTYHLDGLVNSDQARRLYGWYLDENHKKDICSCRKINNCECSKFVFPEETLVDKSDKYVLEVATNICHDPFPLFRNLGLPDSVVYQENNSRERDPEIISQKTFVVNVLHKWIEMKSKPTTLRQLSLSLCKANFHSINEKLYNLFINEVSSS